MNITLEALWAIEKLVDNCGDGEEKRTLEAIWAIVQDDRVRDKLSPYLAATDGSFMEFDGCLTQK